MLRLSRAIAAQGPLLTSASYDAVVSNLRRDPFDKARKTMSPLSQSSPALTAPYARFIKALEGLDAVCKGNIDGRKFPRFVDRPTAPALAELGDAMQGFIGLCEEVPVVVGGQAAVEGSTRGGVLQ
ncbi:hypothetical protein TeGR_g10237 [Tetraparma gracilis]|uniref:Uncharacterized protein n=1 Tax=Tetraparma gracilis TaxID=2962635 RepID=A0ABQ6MYH8_9STRA|nr:hypothetical protein TeGR_g10237 [Tetraparma gracilis]